MPKDGNKCNSGFICLNYGMKSNYNVLLAV